MQMHYAERRAYMSFFCCITTVPKGGIVSHFALPFSLCLAFLNLPLQTLFTIHKFNGFWHYRIFAIHIYLL